MFRQIWTVMSVCSGLLMTWTAAAGGASCGLALHRDSHTGDPALHADNQASPDQTGGMMEEMKNTISWTGALSEEDFKKLHQLTKEAAPPLNGAPIQVAGATCYLSLPPNAKAPVPGIVVIHEWWGLNDHIRHWADRLAGLGYAALAVDLYGGKVADNPDSAMAYVKQVDEKKAVDLLVAAAQFLREDPRVMAPRTASIGWCFGGGYSLLLALNDPKLDAAVMYYGRPVLDPEQLKRIHGPLLGIFANRDKSFTPEIVDKFDAALTKAGVKHEIVRYDANHAFANPSGAAYDERAAAAAWEKVQAFLAANLKGK